MKEKTDLHLPCLKVIQEYASLETQIRKLLTAYCAPFCSSCSNCCCRQEFCQESMDSYWLNMVWQNYGYESAMYHHRSGWLTYKGCRLDVGRSPVCYSFLCDRILENLSQSTQQQTWINIAKLIPLAGKNAIGNKHLVTLTSQEISERLDFNKLSLRIAKCITLFEQYEKELALDQLKSLTNGI